VSGQGWAGASAPGIQTISPPVCGGGDFWTENLRSVVRFEWKKAGLDDLRIRGLKGLRLGAIAHAQARLAVVLRGVEIEGHLGEARGAPAAKQNGNGNDSFHIPGNVRSGSCVLGVAKIFTTGWADYTDESWRMRKSYISVKSEKSVKTEKSEDQSFWLRLAALRFGALELSLC
jgi:hypothetical protein